MPHTRQNGFTLVELAIALMVIGLLIGGVLKGQELIENARVTATIRQVKSYDAAAMIFRNTYNALPGDIRSPNRIPNCTADICNRPGNGNGMIVYSDTSPTNIELYNFFPHMTKAGMIQGPQGQTTTGAVTNATADLVYPYTPFDTTVNVTYITFSNQSSHFYNIPAMIDETEPALPTRAMQSIDSKIDDGNPRRGDVALSELGVCPILCSGGDETCVYDLATTGEACYMGVRSAY